MDGRLRGCFSEAGQLGCYLEQGADLMVSVGPAIALGAIRKRRAIGADGGVPAAVFGIDLNLADEGPLLPEGRPIARRFLAEALVHQEQAVEAFRLDPPDFFFGDVAAEGCTFVFEDSVVLCQAEF